MKIASLRNVPKADRPTQLASVASVFLPRDAVQNTLSTLNSKVLLDVERAFGVSATAEIFNHPRTARDAVVERIQATLFDEIRDSVLTKDSIKGARERLGQKGILPPSLYEVSFMRNFDAQAGSANLSRSFVEACVKHADEIQQLRTKFDDLPEVEHFTLFARRHPSIEDCSILILATRNLAKLVIKAAWHVFHKLVGSDPSEQPLKLLERLAERYGAEFDFGSEKLKFVFDRTILVTPGRQERLMTIGGSERGDNLISIQHTPSALKCILAFSLSAQKYMDDMKAMNLKGSLKPLKM